MKNKKREKMSRKIYKKIKKKEELVPSFLLDLTAVPENVNLLSRTVKSVHHLGPVFFGCHQHHPPAHSLNLRSFHHTQFTASSTENILRDMYFPKPGTVKKCFEARKAFHPIVKRKKFFTDPYLHKCPGRKKVFVPQIASQVIDLGQTNSVIEGETSMEIPFYCLKKISSRTSEAELESVAPSDIWERRRIYMSYKERMAHAHFPKQFVTVMLIGPTIPAALTITKLPSKRKIPSDINIHMKLQEEKITEVTEEIIEATMKQSEDKAVKKAESVKSVYVSSAEVQNINIVRVPNNEENDMVFEVENESYYIEFNNMPSQNEWKEEFWTEEIDRESIEEKNSKEEHLLEKLSG